MHFKKGALSILLKVYLLALAIFTAFRLGLFLAERYRIDHISEKTGDIGRAFLKGLAFDLSLTSYVLILPALVLLILEIFSMDKKWLKRLVMGWIFIFFSVSFFISAADIPYFNHFFAHFSIGAFTWADNPDIVAAMILSDQKYYIYFALAALAIFIFYKTLVHIFAQARPNTEGKKLKKSLLSLFVFVGIFIGLRGNANLEESPLHLHDAEIGHDAFLNQLGHNAPYYFLWSIINRVDDDKPLHFMDTDEALTRVQHDLKVDTGAHYDSPIARKITPDSVSTNKPNVVIILMESLTTAKMARYGNKDELTPFVDSLANNSYYFENAYSAGEHTYIGVFGTLFSLPTLYRVHPLDNVKVYNGWPFTMKKLGYKTLYFTTHSENFDNVGSFMRNNNIDKIYSMKDYPKEEIKTSFGVPDDYLFRYAMPIMDSLHQMKKPFFVTLLTTSDHRPYFLPDYFHPKSDNVDRRMTQYADWSIKQFFEMAKTKPWYDNTVFLLLGDHGAAWNVKYDISLNYHHIPIIIYAPKFIQPAQISKIAGQIDCYPTIMGIIKQPYINTTLGVDLRKKSRPYIFINGDDKLAVLDTQFLLIEKMDNDLGLYKYKNADPTNYIEQLPDKAKEMSQYMHQNNQTFYYIYQNANRLILK